MDPDVSFNNYVDLIQCAVTLWLIHWRLQKFISESLTQELYSSLRQPHFSYEDGIYEDYAKSYTMIFQIHQNMAPRIVFAVDNRHSTRVRHDQTNGESL